MTLLEEAKSYEAWARGYLESYISKIVMSDPPNIETALAVLVLLLLTEKEEGQR
jgi:hypothetical protein